MPSGTQTPQKPSRQATGPPQGAPNKNTATEAIEQDTVMYAPTPNKSDKRRRSAKRAQPTNNTSSQHISSQPPLAAPQMMVDGTSFDIEPQPTLAVAAGSTGKGIKKSNKPRTTVNNVASTPPPRKNRSPQPSQVSSTTPVKLNKTPAQAYAGPTFHASPAASALPIPKLLSRSVPNTEKSQSLKAMMKDDSSSGSSNKSDDSPTLQNSLHVQDSRAREASPLDVFFNAHRQEKERAKMSTPTVTPNNTGNIDRSPDALAQTSLSVSPIPDYMRHHSRHGTNGSNTGMFPLEMDATEKPQPSCIVDQRLTSLRSDSSPSIMTQTPSKEEQEARAKTIALKKFLLSPQPQRPSSASALTNNASGYTSSPSASPSPRPNHQARSISSSSTPVQASHTSPYLARTQDYKPPSPLLYHSISATDRVPSQGRPLSSHLRREVMPNSPTTTTELPSTPTPSRSYNVYQSAGSENGNSTKGNGHIPTCNPSFTKFSPEDALKAAAGENHNSVSLMEDELRKILKLDLLGSGGANGVRS